MVVVVVKVIGVILYSWIFFFVIKVRLFCIIIMIEFWFE